MKTKLKEGFVIRSEKLIERVDKNLCCADFVILHVDESEPHQTIGNRSRSYTNEFVAQQLFENGMYNANGSVIKFIRARVLVGAIDEVDIEVVAQMRKVFIKESTIQAKIPSQWIDYDKKIQKLESELEAVRAEQEAFNSPFAFTVRDVNRVMRIFVAVLRSI